MEETFSNQRDGSNVRQQSSKRPLFALIANGSFQTATPKASQANLCVLKATTHQQSLETTVFPVGTADFWEVREKRGCFCNLSCIPFLALLSRNKFPGYQLLVEPPLPPRPLVISLASGATMMVLITPWSSDRETRRPHQSVLRQGGNRGHLCSTLKEIKEHWRYVPGTQLQLSQTHSNSEV